MRPALLLLPLALLACQDAGMDADETTTEAVLAEPEVLAAETQMPMAATGTLDCPVDKWLMLDDYEDQGLPEADGDFLAANQTRPGVMVSPSGLQYRVIQEGLADGATPTRNERVTVHYHGYFLDGNVFDSSIERGDTIAFAPAQVIAGWTEALTNMQVCEARILYIPGDLAYGPSGRPGIPPNATLLFNVQVLGVER